MLQKINRKISSLQSLITDGIATAITSPTLLISLFVVRHRFKPRPSMGAVWKFAVCYFPEIHLFGANSGRGLVFTATGAAAPIHREQFGAKNNSILPPSVAVHGQRCVLHHVVLEHNHKSKSQTQKRPVWMSPLSELSTALVNLNFWFPSLFGKIFLDNWFGSRVVSSFLA